MGRPHRIGAALAVTIFITLSSGAFPAKAEASPSLVKFAANGFPDNADLRGKLFAYVIGASRDVALAYGEKQLQSSAGPVTVRVEKRSADFIVEFLNASAAGSGDAGRGSVYIQRGNAKGNYILQARILLEDDPSCYLSLYPSGSGTRGDVVMYGAVVKKGLYLSDMIYRILLLSFSDIVDATGRSFDWSVVFKFAPKDAEADYAAELRTALANPPAAEDQAPASSAQIGLGSSTARVSLAAAPSLPSQDAAAGRSGTRTQRIAAAIDKAVSAEALVLELTTSGEAGAREISLAADSAPAFVDVHADPFAKASYAEFPRYDSRGLPLSALRAALYLDLQANPGSFYGLVGEGLRATIIPSFDDAGRLNFAVFADGRESGWNELGGPKKDLRVRIIRLPS